MIILHRFLLTGPWLPFPQRISYKIRLLMLLCRDTGQSGVQGLLLWLVRNVLNNLPVGLSRCCRSWSFEIYQRDAWKQTCSELVFLTGTHFEFVLHFVVVRYYVRSNNNSNGLSRTIMILFSDSGSYRNQGLVNADHFSIFHDIMPAVFLRTHVCWPIHYSSTSTHVLWLGRIADIGHVHIVLFIISVPQT